MDKINVIIPTRNRWDKLRRTLMTIPPDSTIRTFVVCDGDEATFERLQRNPRPNVFPRLLTGHNGAVFCRNYVLKHIRDGGVLCATDDITFTKGMFPHILKEFNAHFPDDDGVLGVCQARSHHATGIALVGMKFLNRYPNHALYYPGYWHFACQEILWLANKLKRFKATEDVWIEHFHPGFYRGEMDQTHKDARLRRKQDSDLRRQREEKGEIWGQ